MLYDSENGEIDILLTGDSLITRRMSMFTEPRFLELVEHIRRADVSITNAEMLFHDYENPPTFVPGGNYQRAHPEIIDELRWMGFDMVASANNHAYDFGENGVLTNIHHLDSHGMRHAGTGKNLSDARAPAYLDTRGGRVALISVTTSGPPNLHAQHQWRDGGGRPGANMIRYTIRYTVDRTTFDVLRNMREQFGLHGRRRPGSQGPSLGFLDHSWGLSQIDDTDSEFYMGDLQSEWHYPAPSGYRFVLGEGFSREFVAVESDVRENLQRINDAKRMADWVVVSIHGHEAGETAEEPPTMVIDFAHQAIDAGADVVHGHGPHRDRGIEIYKGKPIFYSLGHFIVENNTIERVPLDNVLRQGLDPWETTPADFAESRGVPSRPGGLSVSDAYFRDVVATVRFSAGSLAEIDLLPVELGFQRPRSQSGRPVIAQVPASVEQLSLLQRLSEPFGTEITIEGDRGTIKVN